jgi:hypothetical protein
MFALKKFMFGSLAMVSYFLMFLVIIRFFDAMTVANGAAMLGMWLLTLFLLYLADHQPGSNRAGTLSA